MRRAGFERPPWKPLEIFLEDLSRPFQDRSDAGISDLLIADEGPAQLLEDGVTVAHAADAALFDPLATSDERSRAAYQAALRVREGLKVPASSNAR